MTTALPVPSKTSVSFVQHLTSEMNSKIKFSFLSDKQTTIERIFVQNRQQFQP